MATQIVMDRTGDTRYEFDPANSDQVAAAMARFEELMGSGYTAAERTGSGEAQVTRTFNPQAEETLFFARLVGG
jgi:hypothetical protein